MLEKYVSKLSVRDTEKAIKQLKDHFEQRLVEKLNIQRVSAPLFLVPESGLNDDLNGVERQINFDFKSKLKGVVVQSLAKWKRSILQKYGFKTGEGVYTDMNAIRRDEDLTPIHSYYVDQWDWEAIIDEKDRTIEKLKSVVLNIFECFKDLESFICNKYPILSKKLPSEITFIFSQDLEDLYPTLSPKDREREFSKKHGAIFIMQIGKILKSGKEHDLRAPDYDDWELNGDLIVYYEPMDIGLELSSMGIRVDKKTLEVQLKATGLEWKKELDFHKSLLEGKLPFSIGGGIGQSRTCMFFLDKMHIGEVQVSIWDKETLDYCESKGIKLL